MLNQLFGAAVEQADMWVNPFDNLAIKLHHHAQNAVGGRMLRAEIDRVIGDDIAVSWSEILQAACSFRRSFASVIFSLLIARKNIV